MPILDTMSFSELWQPNLMLGAIVLSLLYLYTVNGLRHRFAGAAPVSTSRQVSFVLGMVLLYGAVGSPLDTLSDNFLFSAHMLEHAIISMLSAPLMLIGMPDWLIRPVLKVRAIRFVWGYLSKPLIGILFFNGVFSIEHTPSWMEAALHNNTLHFTQHALLLVSAAAMWWPVLSPLAEQRLPELIQMLYLFLDGLLMTPAFALVTFAGNPLYSTYIHAARVWPWLTPLYDQQLGGIIMKVSTAFSYGTVFTVVFFIWARKERKLEQESIAARRAGIVELYPLSRQQRS